MLRRRFTLEEKLHLVIVASKVQETIDKELGDALLRIADGDDSAFAAVHDRLNVMGNFADADRIRKLVME
jgi:hypothetical protein